LLTGVATLHGQNLMDTTYELPPEVRHWTDVAATPVGGSVRQASPRHVRSVAAGFDDYATHPDASAYTLDEPGGWGLLDNGAAGSELDVSGRLIGGCIETLATLSATDYGDVPRFVREHDADGVILYPEASEASEASEDPAPVIALDLWRMRLAGWFDDARAVLIGRTHAPANDGLTQRDAVVSALGDLPLPVVLDVDCGHVPPALALVNAALTRVQVADGQGSITQTLA
jgi:muramoyltetrapeptide carboxypeptidase LdcA involved in peptidoglycan recycling